jgi:hypothetical protein
MGVSPASRLLIAGLLLASAPAAADAERFDHQGSLGLLVGAEYEGVQSVALNGNVVKDRGGRYVADLGATRSVGYSGNEVLLLAGLGFDNQTGKPLDLGLAGGYRGYFGRDRFKTFVDLDLSAHMLRLFTLGPRVAAGVQWELSSVLGVFAGLAGELGVGTIELRYSAQVLIGFQPRTYLFE